MRDDASRSNVPGPRGAPVPSAKFVSSIFYFPSLRIVQWIRVYNVKQFLVRDVLAGLTVGTLVVPQALAYSLLANQPLQAGLYSALWTPLVYSLFGSSRHLAIGPSALTALLVGTAVGDGPNASLSGPALAFFCGILLSVLGLFGMGAISRWLSHPMLQAYISGAGGAVCSWCLPRRLTRT